MGNNQLAHVRCMYYYTSRTLYALLGVVYVWVYFSTAEEREAAEKRKKSFTIRSFLSHPRLYLCILFYKHPSSLLSLHTVYKKENYCLYTCVASKKKNCLSVILHVEYVSR